MALHQRLLPAPVPLGASGNGGRFVLSERDAQIWGALAGAPDQEADAVHGPRQGLASHVLVSVSRACLPRSGRISGVCLIPGTTTTGIYIHAQQGGHGGGLGPGADLPHGTPAPAGRRSRAGVLQPRARWVHLGCMRRLPGCGPTAACGGGGAEAPVCRPRDPRRQAVDGRRGSEGDTGGAILEFHQRCGGVLRCGRPQHGGGWPTVGRICQHRRGTQHL